MAIRKYIANRFGVSEAGLTPSDARNILKGRGLEQETINMLCSIFEHYFNSNYSSDPHRTGHNINEDSRNTLVLIEKIESALDRPSDNSGFTSTHFATIVMAISCLITIAATALAENPVEYQFLWNEANAMMASATLPEEFLEAASVYQKLVDSGVKNGSVFYNMGTALLLGHQYDRALYALLRAERYSGSNADIKHNMLAAIAGKEKIHDASLPWYRIPLFWHYQLSIFTRISIVIIAFAGFWGALILRTTGSTRIYKPILSSSLIILTVVGSSVLTSIHQENKDTVPNIRIIAEHGIKQPTDNITTINRMLSPPKDLKP